MICASHPENHAGNVYCDCRDLLQSIFHASATERSLKRAGQDQFYLPWWHLLIFPPSWAWNESVCLRWSSRDFFCWQTGGQVDRQTDRWTDRRTGGAFSICCLCFRYSMWLFFRSQSPGCVSSSAFACCPSGRQGACVWPHCAHYQNNHRFVTPNRPFSPNVWFLQRELESTHIKMILTVYLWTFRESSVPRPQLLHHIQYMCGNI